MKLLVLMLTPPRFVRLPTKVKPKKICDNPFIFRGSAERSNIVCILQAKLLICQCFSGPQTWVHSPFYVTSANMVSFLPNFVHIIRDVPVIHLVPGKCRISHYLVLPGPGKIMGPSNKKEIFFYFLLFITVSKRSYGIVDKNTLC